MAIRLCLCGGIDSHGFGHAQGACPPNLYNVIIIL